MYSFASDYLEGAHPDVLAALVKTNEVQSVGYGEDEYCQQATQMLKKMIHNENVDVHYLIGGTQTNMIVIASALRSYQAVMTVDSGHINVHETGAVEYTGHKIVTRPHRQGKLYPDMIESVLCEHQDEHAVAIKMVYISQTTEYGTYYTLEELKAIYQCCQKHHLYLFIDGARLGSALVKEDAPTLQEMACYSDVFYIGGTKMGALFGECLVIINDELKADFRYHLKQKGAMLAKGRLLGVQFATLWKNQLYFKIGQHENECADILRDGFRECGYNMYIDTTTNQIFVILDDKTLEYISKQYATSFIMKTDANHTCVRLVTSWATSKQVCHEFVEYLKQMH